MALILCQQDGYEAVQAATQDGREVSLTISAPNGGTLPERMVGEFRHQMGPFARTDNDNDPHRMWIRVLPDLSPLGIAMLSDPPVELRRSRPPLFSRINDRVRAWIGRALDEGYFVNVG